MTNDDLLKQLKGTLLLDDTTRFDKSLTLYLNGSKEYVDNILDNVPSNDDLYNLAVVFLAQYEWLNKDAPKLKILPVSLNSLLNKLKMKYSN